MTNKELQYLIQQGEGCNLEFKEGYNSNLAREICAMANANGGMILLGISDDGKVKPFKLNNKIRSEIQDLARNFDPSFVVEISEFDGITIINVPEGKKKPYASGGKFYMRQGANSQQLSRDEIRDFFTKEGLIRFDEMPNDKFDFTEDFSEDAFNNFRTYTLAVIARSHATKQSRVYCIVYGIVTAFGLAITRIPYKRVSPEFFKDGRN